jgi:Cu+-exporting ATPase
VTVRGGYSPDLIRVRQGVPLRIVFDRQEGGECTSRVVFPDFAVNQPLPASARTTVRFVPDRAGEFGFACGMNVVLGTLVVEPAAPGRQVPPARGEPAGPAAGLPPAVPEPAAEVAEAIGATETGEAAERRAEIADLTRRVGVGAVLTAPVLFAVMAGRLLSVGPPRQPLGRAGPDHARDALFGLAHPPDGLVEPGAPVGGDEPGDHHRDLGGLRLQPVW